MNYSNLLRVGIILLILGFSNSIKTQSTIFTSCGFNESHNELIFKDNKYKTKHEEFENSLLRYDELNVDNRSNPQFTLPVVVHIIHNGGAENITNEEVLKGIENLNAAYENIGYYDQNTGIKTGFQFCLAKRDPDGNLTSGINRVQSTLTNMDASTDDLSLKNLIRWEPTEYINIWLVNDICRGSRCSVVGYAYFPAAHGTDVDGLVAEASYFARTEGSSAVQIHEMGHYLGLYHTFQGGCKNNNCSQDGDKVCDTPPDESTFPVKCGDDFNSCNTDANSGFSSDQNDMYWNYMDYGDFDCYSAFTEGQRKRMIYTILNIRNSLLNSKACIPPCSENLIANFNISDDIFYLGQTGTFINSSTPNASKFTWEKNGEYISSTKDLNHNFTELGTQHFTLKVYNSDNSCYDFISKKITVLCPAKVEIKVNSTTAISSETVNFKGESIETDTYKWLINNDFYSSNPDIDYTFGEEGVYKITLISINDQWDCSDSTSINIIVTCPVKAEFQTSSFFPSINEDVQFTNTSINANTNQWTVNGNDQSNNTDFNYTFPSSGEYTVCLTTNNGSCEKEFCMQIFVLDFDELDCDDVFFKTIGDLNSTEQGHYFIKIDNDKYVIGGSIENESLLVFIDSKGKVLKTKRIDFLSEQNSIIFLYKDKDGYLLGSGIGEGNDRTFVFKYDIENDIIIWNKIIGPSFSGALRIYDIVQLDTKNYLIAEQINGVTGEDAYISEINHLTGETIWHKNYNTGSVESFRRILVKNGSIYGFGRFALYSSSQSDFRSTVMKMDMNGNEIWTKYYLYPLAKNARLYITTVIDDNGILFSGTGNENGSSLNYNTFQLVKIDTSGNVLWDKSYGIENATWISTRRSINLPDGYLFAGDYQYSGNLRKISLIRVDKIGNIIWSKSYKYDNNLVLGSAEWNNGFYYLSGRTDDDIIFMKLDENGNFKEDCVVEVTDDIISVKDLNRFSETVTVDKNNSNITTSFRNPNINNITLNENNICKIECIDTCSYVPDAILYINGANCVIDSFIINFEICNIGNATLPINTPVTFYNQNPLIQNAEINDIFYTTDSILKDNCKEYSITLKSTEDIIFAFANDNGTSITPFIPDNVLPNNGIIECEWSNNMGKFWLDNSQTQNLYLGKDTTMCVSGVVNLNANDGFKSYLWQDGSTDSIFTAWEPGTFWVEVTDFCGNIQRDTINVYVDPATIIDLGEIIDLCGGQSISFEIDGFVNYEWKPENVVDCNNCNKVSIQTDSTINISVIAYDDKGCYSTDSVKINVFDAINIKLPEDTTIYLGDKILILPTTSFNESYKYLWSPDNNLSCIECYSPEASPLITTNYTLEVIDENGCTSTDDITIDVIKDINIYIPNIFTPNGDGINDYFYVRGNEKGLIGISDFKIYNRWGELIYENSNFQINHPSFGWDGRFKGKVVNPDVFVYIIVLDLIDGTQIIKKGDITVIE